MFFVNWNSLYFFQLLYSTNMLCLSLRNSQVCCLSEILSCISLLLSKEVKQLKIIIIIHIMCYTCCLSYISRHSHHATPAMPATRFRLIYIRWLIWHSTASLKFSVCTHLLLVRVPNGRYMTAWVALSIASDLVGSNPVADGAMLPCGLCCPPLPLADEFYMHYYTGQVDQRIITGIEKF